MLYFVHCFCNAEKCRMKSSDCCSSMAANVDRSLLAAIFGDIEFRFNDVLKTFGVGNAPFVAACSCGSAKFQTIYKDIYG